MDGAEVSMACMCSNRSCPACWCPDAQLADGKTCEYRKAAEVFAKLDAGREELLDEEDRILRGKGEKVSAFEQRIKHKLLPCNAWRLIPLFELFMSCPKDELHQWYDNICLQQLTYLWYKSCITNVYVVTRYLGLFGDHIVPAILYKYTQVLRRPDLLSSKGKPLITKARLETVWTRLADRLATVVADTSMVTITPEYAGHFYDLYIHGKENAKLTGDRMKLLMLALPFMARDLIAPEVCTLSQSLRYRSFIPCLSINYH